MVFVALRRLKFQFEGRSSMQEPREGGAASSSMPRQLDPIRGFRALDKSDESAGWLPGPVTTLRTRNAAVNDRPIANTSHKLTMVHSYSTGNTTTTTQWAREAILTTTTKTKMSTTRLARGSVAALVTPERSARTKKERTNNLGTCEDADNGERDGDDESDSGNEVPRNRFEEKRACKHTGEMLGSTVYEDGDKVYRGAVDTRGITPFVTFTSSETPPSQVKSKIVTSSQHPTCGFCNSSNLLWILRCSFCGSARMSDAPRLKYLVDTILSVNPLIKAEELAKKILDYAKFDRVAMKVEAKFKQASLVRAKTAIMMMNRTISILRHQMLRMIFLAWKGRNKITVHHNSLMHRLISIKDNQHVNNLGKQLFMVWKGRHNRITEERAQRLSIAIRRNDMNKTRQVWGGWQRYMRMKSKEKLEQAKAHYEAELNDAPHQSLKVIDKLKENLVESRRLVFAATETIFELLHLSLTKADHDVQKTLQLKGMYPSTVGTFFDAVHGQEILDGLSSGHVATFSDDFGYDDDKDDETLKAHLLRVKDRIDKMHPSESLMQWLTFQRRRASEMNYIRESAFLSSNTSINASNGQSQGARLSVKIKTKDKHKVVKDISNLQELRASIASPSVMMKLLCHTSEEAKAEYDKIRKSESVSSAAAVAAENSTASTSLSASAQLQLKIYFKLVHRILDLPPDIVNRDHFVLNDFDSLYPYSAYLFLFHPNYVSPGLPLAPQYHLSYNFFSPQWEKVKNLLMEDKFDPLAQQQYYIFLAKIKRVNKQFLRFGDICKSVSQIAHWHQNAVTRDTFNDFARRVMGKDSNISVALEKATLAAWVSLPRTKLLGLCENEAELAAVENVFKDNVLDLIKIFRIYGSAAGGKGILEQEFLKVMTKAGLTDKKNILRSQLQAIYQQSRQLYGGMIALPNSNSLPNNDSDGDDDSDDRGATPNEFFEALTRVAYHNLHKRRETITYVATVMGTAESNMEDAYIPGCNLLAFVTDLVVDKIVPLTKKFQEQGLTFKKQMVNPDVQYICKAQEKKLKRVFTTYSQRNKNPSSRGKLIDIGDFEMLLKDKRLLDALFPHGRIKQLVTFVQQDGEIASTASSINGVEGDCEFAFSEFVEALAAIAVYRHANPYLPLAKKLETFFEENF